jgi:hypothetical protein
MLERVKKLTSMVSFRSLELAAALMAIAGMLAACGDGANPGDHARRNALGFSAAELASSITWETESLSRSSNVSTLVESDPGYSNGQSVKVMAAAVNDYVEFTLPTAPAGTYNVAVYYKSWNNRPIVQASLDGVSQGSPIDMYGANPAFQVAGALGTKTWADNEVKKLRLTVTQKNAASSGYVMHVDKLVLQPVGGGNAAPTITSGPSANPAAVTGTTTALSVVATDDNPEANLTYTWATTGTPPAAVAFSANGTNAAKNTTATSTKPGSYGFQVTVRDQQGATAVGTLSVSVSSGSTPLLFEAETLARNSDVSTQVESDPGYSGGQSVKVLAAAINDYAEFILPGVTAGTYEVVVYYKSWNNRPIVQGSLDGASQGAPVDMFASAPAFQVRGDMGTKTFTSDGNKTLRLTVTGKNANSSGYSFHIDKIALEPAGGIPPPPPPPPPPPSISYSTNFDLTENPISEGQRWISGTTTPNESAMRTSSGWAFGTQTGHEQQDLGLYNDSHAFLADTRYQANQTASGKIRYSGANIAQGGSIEAEMLLRMSIGPLQTGLQYGDTREYGYEINMGMGTFGTYIQIGRWKRTNLFDSMKSGSALTSLGIHDGDVFAAQATQSGGVLTIKVTLNGQVIATATDDPSWLPAIGTPGIGQYRHDIGGTLVPTDYCLTSFTGSSP